MAANHTTSGLLARLPSVRGTLTANAPLAKYTWFRVGGSAEVLFEPADVEDLAAFIAARPVDVPVTVIGVASNLLVRDGGVAGVTVKLGKAFSSIKVEGRRVVAGAAAIDIQVARAARDNGIAGLEFMVGIPGTVGGALRMNAGAYDREIADIVVSARAIDERGDIQTLPRDMFGFSYRHCMVPEGWIFVDAEFEGELGSPAEIAARMEQIQATREASQPIRERTGGSTFANPPGMRAWELIDAAGCRGLRRGDAMVSPDHCNFLINVGQATAADLEGLGEEVRRRVKEQSGVLLEWEVRRIGSPLTIQPREVKL